MELAALAGDQYQEHGHPKVDVKFALRAYNSIAKSVLGPKTNPKLQLELNRVLAEHERTPKETEISIADELARPVRKREELEKTEEIISCPLLNKQLLPLHCMRNTAQE